MFRTAIAIAFATLMVATVSGVSQAAPIAPLPAGVSANAHVTQVRCWRCWHGGWHGGWHRHCWRGPYGHLHCR